MTPQSGQCLDELPTDPCLPRTDCDSCQLARNCKSKLINSIWTPDKTNFLNHSFFFIIIKIHYMCRRMCLVYCSTSCWQIDHRSLCGQKCLSECEWRNSKSSEKTAQCIIFFWTKTNFNFIDLVSTNFSFWCAFMSKKQFNSFHWNNRRFESWTTGLVRRQYILENKSFLF